MDWLNDNSGTIQAFATGILIGVTTLYVVATYKLVLETRRQGRPYVYVEIINNAGFIETCLRNAGGRLATNVQMTVTQDIPIPGNEHRAFLASPLFQTPIPALSPGGCVRETVAHFPSISGPLRALDSEKRVLSYSVEYSDGNEKYRESLSFDLSHLLGSERPFPEPDVYLALGELRDYLTGALGQTNEILSSIAAELRDRSSNRL